jgi:hypothetical protein
MNNLFINLDEDMPSAQNAPQAAEKSNSLFIPVDLPSDKFLDKSGGKKTSVGRAVTRGISSLGDLAVMLGKGFVMPDSYMPTTRYDTKPLGDVVEKAVFGDVKPKETKTFTEKTIERALPYAFPAGALLKAGSPLAAASTLIPPIVGQGTEDVTNSPVAGALAEIGTGVGIPYGISRVLRGVETPSAKMIAESKVFGGDAQSKVDAARAQLASLGSNQSLVTAPELLAQQGINFPLGLQQTVSRSSTPQASRLAEYLDGLTNKAGEAAKSLAPNFSNQTRDITERMLGASEGSLRGAQKAVSASFQDDFTKLGNIPLTNIQGLGDALKAKYGKGITQSKARSIDSLVSRISEGASPAKFEGAGFMQPIIETPATIGNATFGKAFSEITTPNKNPVTSSSNADEILSSGDIATAKNWLFTQAKTKGNANKTVEARNFAQSLNSNYSNAMQANVEPIKSILTKTGLSKEQIASTNPNTVYSALQKYYLDGGNLNNKEVETAFKWLKEQDPSVAADFVKLHIDKSAQAAQTASGVFDLGKFNSSFGSTDKQRKSFLDAASSAGVDTRELQGLLKVGDIAARSTDTLPNGMNALNKGLIQQGAAVLNPNISSSAVQNARLAKRAGKFGDKYIFGGAEAGLNQYEKEVLTNPKIRDIARYLTGAAATGNALKSQEGQ